jgi:hypothetical protein
MQIFASSFHSLKTSFSDTLRLRFSLRREYQTGKSRLWYNSTILGVGYKQCYGSPANLRVNESIRNLVIINILKLTN